MPPPPKPRPKTSQRRPLQTLNEEHISRYFSDPVAAVPASGYVSQNNKRLLSVLNDGKENMIRPLRRKTPAAGQSKTTRPYDNDAVSCRSSKASIHNVEPLIVNFTGGEGGHIHPIQQQIPTSSPEDDELDLYLIVGKERNGFRTAKSFGRAIAERKNIK